MTVATQSLQELAVNSIRFLAVDAVQKANSGHPGLPMGAAPMAYVLWKNFMKFNPKNPDWSNRDRFVLSAGHGCMLQYALLYLTGYDVSLDDLKNFRQWGSKTPGHPENFETPGVEVTTGPLGQGIGNGVGLAIAEAHLAARFNKPGHTIVDHYTYVIAGDGCNMEGVSGEAASMAGHMGLGKLIVLYDSNSISIEGSTDIAFTEDVGKRYEAYGWHVTYVNDGDTDLDAIEKAIAEAKSVTDKPSFIVITTTIGYGSPNKSGTCGVHGAPLGPDEIALTKQGLGYPAEPAFHVPDDVLSHFRAAVDKGGKLESSWNESFAAYKAAYPSEAAEYERMMSGELPDGWEAALETILDQENSTRKLSGSALNALSPALPELVGGSADLNHSNMTEIKNEPYFDKGSYEGRNFHFGVREHGMGAVVNGMVLHGGLLPYCATFLIFTDYMRAAIRLSALSEARVLYVMTHDSVALGEDGPTHQPVETIASLRLIPNLHCFRPADVKETVGAYKSAIKQTKTPSLFAFSRQGLKNLEGTSVEGTMKGGYTVVDADNPEVILIATGSEVALAVEAAGVLASEGKAVRVVSMPSCDVFDAQPKEYRDSILPPSVTKRVTIEAGVTGGWYKYAGTEGAVIGMDRFGASAPGGVCMEKFGFTVENICDTARGLLV